MKATEQDHLRTLLSSLGIDGPDFMRFLVWAMTEHLVSYLAEDRALVERLRCSPDGLRQFRDLLRMKTHRRWSPGDTETLYARVLDATTTHYRQPVTYQELFRLLCNSKHECAWCHRSPPEVKLHIDHIYPASKGGPSKFPNLQFLCSACNIKKSNKVQRSDEQCLNYE